MRDPLAIKQLTRQELLEGVIVGELGVGRERLVRGVEGRIFQITEVAGVGRRLNVGFDGRRFVADHW